MPLPWVPSMLHDSGQKVIKEGDVGYVPENGFCGGKNSKLALKYLQWLEKKNPGLHLQYALKRGEKQVKANGRHYSLDGYNVLTNEVYENKYTRHLMPRDALYGGRTPAFKSLARATKAESLEYYDFNFMYPFLNAIGAAYPRGNLEVITFGVPPADQPLNKRGLVYGDVLPAVSAPMGVLPCKIAKKLMFPLCRTCAEQQQVDKECPHRLVLERFITGVWTTDELEKAVSAGYKVFKYHETWHWNDWVKGGFFADYIRPLLKIKHESSGWPKENMSDEERKDHIKAIFLEDSEEQRDEVALKNLPKLGVGKVRPKPVDA